MRRARLTAREIGAAWVAVIASEAKQSNTTYANRVLARRLLDGRGVGASLFA
jgi:hypothetical protein